MAIKPLYGRCVALDRHDGRVVQLRLTFKSHFQIQCHFQIQLSNLTFKASIRVWNWNCHHFHNFLNIQLLVSLHILVCAYVYMSILEYVNIDKRQFDNHYHIPVSGYFIAGIRIAY